MTVRHDVSQMREVEEALRRSEAKYREIFEKIQDIFFQTDDQGLIVEVSPSVERYGYTREELIGTPAVELYEEPKQRITLRQLLENGEITDSEARLKARDGRVVDFSVSSHVLWNADGSPAGMEGCLRDISDRKLVEEELRKHRDRLEELIDERTAELTQANESLLREVEEHRQAEEALRASEERFKLIATNTPDHVLVQDKDLRYTCVLNPQLGLTENDMIGRTDLDILTKEDAVTLTTIKKRVLETGNPEYVNVPIVSIDGGKEYFEGSYVPSHDSEGRVNGLLGYFRNVTERVQAQEALRESEEKYRQLVENLQEGIWVLDKDGHTTFANARMAEMLGYTVDEMLGKHLLSFMDEQWQEVAKEKLERRRQGVTEQHDFEFLRKDGTRVYTSLATNPATDRNGNYIGALAGVMDITERKMAEEALRESEQRFRQVLDVSSDMIYKLDLESDTFDYISPSVLKMTGFTREEFIAMGPRGLRRRIHPEDWPDFRRGSEEFVELGSHPRFEYRLQCKDGEYRWLNDNRALVRGESGRPLALVGTVRDVTERRQAEEQARQLHAEQVRANELRRMVRILERMAATLGHELRNPLGVIGNSVYFLANQAQIDGPKAQKHVEIIGHEVASARRVIDDILEFAHVPQLFPAAAGINAVVDSALARSQIPANIRVVRKLAVDLPPLICDEERLEWAFIDIITNAVQAMPHGGRLGVKTSRSGDDIEVVFSDSGVGIAPENLDKVFEPMFTTKLRGIGLGLTVVRRTVEQHGGGIRVRSRLGWGAIFRITLPRDCRPFATKGGRVA